MIISHPTGFYRFDIPDSLSDTGNVTYTISNSQPNNVAAFFPVTGHNTGRKWVVRAPFPSTNINTSLEIPALINVKRPRVGDLIDVGHVDVDFNNSNNTKTSNLLPLPTEIAHLTQSIIERITSLIDDRSKLFDELMALNVELNESNKLVTSLQLLKNTKYFDDNIQQLLTNSINNSRGISSKIAQIKSSLSTIDDERLSLQQLIGGVSNAD